MSRIGKKPIPLPQGVKYEVKGNTVVVNGPKGQVQTHLPSGVELKQADGHIQIVRKSDQFAAVHGLARALVNNAVEGVTKGWNREIEIVGIGYRAELKGKNTVVFTLGYSHPIEFPLPTGVTVAVDAKQTKLTVSGIDRQKVGTGCGGHARPASTGPIQAEGCPVCGREIEEEGRQDRSEIIAVIALIG